MSKQVLCLLGEGFEEIEAVAPIDILRRAGAKVTVASVTGERMVKGRSDLMLASDQALDTLDLAAFDLLILPGGPGVKALRADGRAAALARRFADEGKWIGAICAAPAILKDAGLLADIAVTAHASVHAELGLSGDVPRVLRDGQIISSRGAGTAIDFSLELVRLLFGEREAEKIAASIMA